MAEAKTWEFWRTSSERCHEAAFRSPAWSDPDRAFHFIEVAFPDARPQLGHIAFPFDEFKHGLQIDFCAFDIPSVE
jgi:hypothetical protein